MPKILLITLPPASITQPLLSFGALKSYLNQKGIEVEIKYWNILLDPLLKTLLGNDIPDDYHKVLPFTTLISTNESNIDTERLTLELQKINPSKKYGDPNYYLKLINEFKTALSSNIRSIVKQIDCNEYTLIGFSTKFYQWIPAVIISEIIKKEHKNIKIVTGGYLNKESAFEMLEQFKCFDFAIWGEGEIPLFQLYETIKSNNSFSNISRLYYRSDENIISGTEENDNSFADIDTLAPNFDDYFNLPVIKNAQSSFKDKILIPLNSIRGCVWNKCKFCTFPRGYKYRKCKPELISKLIEQYVDKYKINKFVFVDSDVFGLNIDYLDSLLNNLGEIQLRRNINLEIVFGIIPVGIDSNIIRKLKITGFASASIGFEAFSDGLLKKMDKKIELANTIFFMKFANKYGIEIVAAMIKGIPNEEEIDIYESRENLHFFRFFLGQDKFKYSIESNPLILSMNSRYYKQLSNIDKNKFNQNILFDILNLNLKNRFALFDFVMEDIPHKMEWSYFDLAFNYYKNTKSNYKVFKEKNKYLFHEFHKDYLINKIELDGTLWMILEIANNQICDIETINNGLIANNIQINQSKLEELIAYLKSKYLIYSNKDKTKIISIIDTQLVN